MIDVVVPSAKPVDLLERTLPALSAAVRRAGLSADAVVVVDERLDRGIGALVDTFGFARVETGGLGAGPARNRGAAAGSRSWIAFVDDDVELDVDSLASAQSALLAGPLSAVVGGLRPPTGAPRWLQWAYDDAVLSPASASASEGALPPVALAGALLIVARRPFMEVGGFPAKAYIEDSLLGLALARHLGPSMRTTRLRAFSGVHHYVPTWGEWLQRCERTGRRLREVLDQLPDDDAQTLVEAHGLGPGFRAAFKRSLGQLPRTAWRRPAGHVHARLAASAAESRGFAASVPT